MCQRHNNTRYTTLWWVRRDGWVGMNPLPTQDRNKTHHHGWEGGYAGGVGGGHGVYVVYDGFGSAGSDQRRGGYGGVQGWDGDLLSHQQQQQQQQDDLQLELRAFCSKLTVPASSVKMLFYSTSTMTSVGYGSWFTFRFLFLHIWTVVTSFHCAYTRCEMSPSLIEPTNNLLVPIFGLQVIYTRCCGICTCWHRPTILVYAGVYVNI